MDRAPARVLLASAESSAVAGELLNPNGGKASSEDPLVPRHRHRIFPAMPAMPAVAVAAARRYSPSVAVSSCGVPTGLDSEEPRWRR